MADHSIGRIFAEINLDPDPFNKGLARLKTDAGVVVLGVEKNFQTLGIKSSEYFNLTRAAAENAYQGVKNSATATANDILRAEEARNAKMISLNEQQFGKQTTLLEGLKTHWLATSAAIVGAWALVGKSMEYIELGAKAQQAEESFRLVAESSKIGADALLANLNRAAAGTVDDSDIMQQAVKGMVLGLDDKQLVTIMENARIAARYAGTDVKTAFEDITNAIGTDMPKALRQYGLITREESRQVQAALAAGSKDVSLFDLAMAHAAVNSAKFGEAQLNAAESVQIFKRVVNETREAIGNLAISTSQYLLAGAEGLNAFATRGAAALMKLMGQEEAYTQLVDAANLMIQKRNALLGIQTEEEKKAADAAKESAKETLTAAEAALKKEQDRVKAAADAAANAKEAKRSADEVTKTIYESLTAQQGMIAEAQEFGVKYMHAQAAEQDKIAKDALARQESVLDEARDLGNRFGQEELQRARSNAEEAVKIKEKSLKEQLDLSERYAEFDEKLQQEVNDLSDKYRKEEIAKAEAAWKDSVFNIRGITEDAFGGVRSAISTSIRGIIQGTQTMQDAFKRMGESIMLGLVDSIVNRGLKYVQNALLDFVFGSANGGGGGINWASLGSSVVSTAGSMAGGIQSAVSSVASWLGYLDTGMWKVPSGTSSTSGYSGNWGKGAAGVAALHPGEMVVPPDIAELLRRAVAANGGSNFAGMANLLTGGGGRGGTGPGSGSYGQMTSAERSSLSSLGGFGSFGTLSTSFGIASGLLGMGPLGKTAVDAMISGILGFDAVRGMLGVDPAIGYVSPTAADYQGIADTYGYNSVQEASARTAAAIGQSLIGDIDAARAGQAAAAAGEAEAANRAAEAQEASQRDAQGGYGGPDAGDTSGSPGTGANDGSNDYASGGLFRTRGRTRMTVGEAGSETVAVLRNPREVSAGGGSQITVNIDLRGSVVDNQVPTNIARAIKKSIDRIESRKINY